MFEQLGDQDASFLYLETAETPQHVGGVSLVELPPGYTGDFCADYRRQIGERMRLIPLLHRKLVSLPFDIDHPFWVDEPDVDLQYHIRQQTLPSPGRMSQLEELVGRLHSNFLDRSRPLWEFYVIQGLETGHVAIYTKIHHAAMDGAASQQLIATMYDPTPEPRHFDALALDTPARQDKPGVRAMARGVARHVVKQEIRALQFVPEVLKAWARVALPDADTLKFGNTVLPPLRPPRTLFNVAITSQRVYAARTVSLSRCRRLAKAGDVKLNDVVLALCAGALRRYLLDHDALPGPSMTAMVPVSLHEPGDSRSNQNTVILCKLATDIADPVERLQVIRTSSTDQKRLLANIRNMLLPDLALVGSGLVTRALSQLYRRAKLADRLPPLANLTVSNVPGPPVPLYIAGAKLLTCYPCSIPFHGSALNITVQSYCDALDFGLVACRRTVPDLAELADHLAPALEELEAALSREATPGRGVAPTARAKPAKPRTRPAAKPPEKKTAAPTAGKRARPVPAAKPARRRVAPISTPTKGTR
jgi:WS/DGAT/MGAT family acyltransferase